MKGFFAMLRAAMRSIRRMVYVTIEVAGRMISVLRPDPAYVAEEPVSADAGYEQAMQSQVPAGPSDASRYDRIRELATDLARNPNMDPTEILARGVGPLTAAWLSSMQPTMLVRVALANDQQLADCINGKRPIRGVFEYDPMATPGAHARAHRESHEIERELDAGAAFAM